MTPTELDQIAPLPTLSYPDAAGTSHVLTSELETGPLLLGIYKSSCQASKWMMPALELARQVYETDGLTVRGVAQDSANITRSFARRLEMHYPVLIEGDDYPISVAFDIFATPTIYLIRQDGTVAYTTMGFFREQLKDLSAAIAMELGVTAKSIIPEENEEYPLFVPG